METISPSIRNIRIRLSNKERLILFIIVIMFCVHGTDVKLGFIKLSELSLLIYFLSIYNKLSKSSLILLCLFCLYFINSTIVSVFTTFYPPAASTGGLKQPYLISFSRFLELISCLGFVEYVKREFNILTAKGFTVKRIFDYFLMANCLLGLVYLCDLIALVLNLYSINSSFFYYDNYRLKGTFAEGGPNGLCFAFLLCFSLPYCSRIIRLMGFLLLFTLVILAQSKAGIMALVLYAIIQIYVKVNINTFLTILLLILGVPIMYYVVSTILDSYIQSIANLDTMLMTNQDDPSVIMGRVAGMIIVPKVILSNFWFGIGLGNYALVRNNPVYSGIFPDVALWDSPGLGGLVDIFLETGLLGFIGFVCVLVYIYKLISKTYKYRIHLALCFILPYICGVQLYFQYPWLALGFALYISGQKETNLISKTT